jgi:hypothetical protein
MPGRLSVLYKLVMHIICMTSSLVIARQAEGSAPIREARKHSGASTDA